MSCQLHDTDRERLAAFTLREGADQLTLLSFLVTAGRSPLFLFLCFFLGTRFFYSFNYLSNILYNAIFFFEKIYDAILVSYFIYKFFKSGNLLVYILKKKKKVIFSILISFFFGVLSILIKLNNSLSSSLLFLRN